MRFECSAIIRAHTKHVTAKSCINITKWMHRKSFIISFNHFCPEAKQELFLEKNMVVRSFESHGMRSLARAVHRVNA